MYTYFFSAAVKPSVAFRTFATASYKFKSTNTPLTFQVTDYNIGDAYNVETGIFKVPVNGTYLFTAHICMASGKGLNIYFVVDGVRVTRSLIEGGRGRHHRQCLAVTDVLNLTEGSRVWIIRNTEWNKRWSENDQFLLDEFSSAYFTGVLV